CVRGWPYAMDYW
nr:immunoglobulin heavy chain junction region [Mus musculus]MBK4198581.1 immunoglobulin heavy chain junction region [Mus musculus]